LSLNSLKIPLVFLIISGISHRQIWSLFLANSIYIVGYL
jgi:hypothetical protein